jgi:hypothetical protein
MRLKIQLHPTWYQDKKNDGPATFCRANSSSAFQVSWAEKKGGAIPNPSGKDLIAFALNFGAQNNFGEVVESRDGTCRFGNYGTAIFRSTKHSRIQLWIVSNGRDFIFATHICDQVPSNEEISEAQSIAESLALG